MSDDDHRRGSRSPTAVSAVGSASRFGADRVLLPRIAAAPPAGVAPVRAAEERQRRPQQDLQVDAAASGARRTRRRARSARPTAASRDRGSAPSPSAPAARRAASAAGRCTSRPGSAASAAVRSGSSRRGRRSRAGAARRSTSCRRIRPHARDAAVARVDREPRTLTLRVDDHRPELQQLEVHAVPPDARLPEEDRAAVLELDRERRRREERARDDEPEPQLRGCRGARFIAFPPPPPTSPARRGGGSSRARRPSPR